jgi:hypothetical protein
MPVLAIDSSIVELVSIYYNHEEGGDRSHEGHWQNIKEPGTTARQNKVSPAGTVPGIRTQTPPQTTNDASITR